MKALEILKKERSEQISLLRNENIRDNKLELSDIEYIKQNIKNIDESISELEELEKRIKELDLQLKVEMNAHTTLAELESNKTCYNCKFSTFYPYNENEGRWKTCTCAWSPALDNKVTPSQWCNAYELKEIQ